MNKRAISVQAQAAGPGGTAGEVRKADLMVCDCGSEVFYIYAVADGPPGAESHLHLQCVECGATWCRGDKDGCGVQVATPARQCRICGCRDNEACMGPDGNACAWVEEDLCSACVGKEKGLVTSSPTGEQMPEFSGSALHLTEADIEALERLPDASLKLPAVHAFMALSALQLALRHPNIPANVGFSVTILALALQNYISVTSNIAAVCEAGWDPTQDVPAERRIIVP